MAPELLICALSSELPLDGSTQRVSICLPGVDFALQKLQSWEATIQALAAEDANLDLCHVEPTRMPGRVVEAHSAQQRASRTLAQHVLEARSEVNVQVVQHEVHLARAAYVSVRSAWTKTTKSTLPRWAVTETTRCPALGSTATNRLVLPLRTYS